MRSFLLRMLALPLVLLLMAPLALHAQTSATITSGNGEGTYTIEFLGVVDNGNGTYTWSYRVTEVSGKNLSHWTLGLCMDLAKVFAYTPDASDSGIESIDFGTDSGGTFITGIKWNVEDDFDNDGDEDDDERVFTFTLNMAFDVGPVPVGTKTGGKGDKSGTGSINGPVCTTIDKCASVDPSDLPSWDGVITNNGDGTGSTVLNALLGLKRIELFNQTNLVLDDVQDLGGTSLVGTDQFDCTEITSDGCLKYVWTGDEADAPMAVKLLLRAPANAGSFFFVHFTDCCDHTVRVDPELTLYSVALGDETQEAPGTFVLEQNYPNPFNPQTTIRFALPEAATARLTVYDLLGREVATLFAGDLPAGTFTATWDGRDAAGAPVPSGVYLYRMQAGSIVQTRQMMLLK